MSRTPVGRTTPSAGAVRVTAGAGRFIAGPYTSGSASVILTSADGGVTGTVEPLDTSVPILLPGGPAAPDPSQAGGSAQALFMPVPGGAGRVLGLRAGETAWQQSVFFEEPPPAPSE